MPPSATADRDARRAEAITDRRFFSVDAASLARALLGTALVHVVDGIARAGRIVETEAYVGVHDLACHASKGRTARTEVMFGPAGHAYVYLIYGMYDCFNVVCESEGIAAAVLVRALAPLENVSGATDGPGKLCRALAITTRSSNKLDLVAPGAPLFLARGEAVDRAAIESGPRIGVDYAGEWTRAPLRFWLRDEPWVSRVDAATRRRRGRRGILR